MRFESTNSKFPVEIDINPWGHWESSDYVKGFEFCVAYSGLNFSSKYSGEAYLNSVREDELLTFISELENLFQNLNGKAVYEFSFSGEAEPDGELAFYRAKVMFSSLDSLGNVAFTIGCQREHRYSETKEFIHESSLEFHVHLEALEKFIKYLKSQYQESNINNENY